MIYCIDSSSFIDAGERYYPQDIFPAFWDKLEQLLDAGRLKAPITLLEELQRKDDDWRQWVYEREDKLIVPPDAAMFDAVRDVVAQYQLQNSHQFNPDKLTGDPFFIALAKCKGMTLITTELSRPGGFRIPAICRPLGVDTITLLNMIRQEGWRF
jgi:hypothetical protein